MRVLQTLCVVSSVSLAGLTGCASGPGDTHDGAPRAGDASSRPGRATSEGDFRPIEGDGATLVVRGLSCPKCANNVNLQLGKVEGVRETHIDMGAGEVRVVFDTLSPTRPSRAQLTRAITDAGFTVVDIRTP